MNEIGFDLSKVSFNVLSDSSYDSIRGSFPNSDIYWKWVHSDGGDGVNPPLNPSDQLFQQYINRGYQGIELWGLSGVTKDFVDTANSVRLGVVTWGVHTPTQIQAMVDVGVQGFLSCDVASAP